MKPRVLLGLSSGIDSSVTATILKNKGLDVIGVTFIFSDIEKESVQVKESLHHIIKKLDIEHFFVDLRKEFDEIVISYFLSEYRFGRTPFPCAVCNPQIKFANLIKLAKKLNCKYISTGHYAQIIEYKNFRYIKKAIDKEKDQSFFLWGLRQDVLHRLIFPLGRITKNEVRKLAKKNGLDSLIEKEESRGVCFIQGNNYRNFFKQKGLNLSSGKFIDKNGKILGEHSGITDYTIGQRRGLGLQCSTPQFVSDIRPSTNEIVLSDFNNLFKTKIIIEGYHFNSPESIDKQKFYVVKIRYRLQENTCRINIKNGKLAIIELLEPVAMVANGQTAVLYDKNKVIGGGFIQNSE